jgi:hypothetical protein
VSKVIHRAPARLDRVLVALEQELLHASDDEIREAAKELRMNLDMKGAVAFMGLKFPMRMELEDVFDLSQVDEATQKRLAAYSQYVQTWRKLNKSD